MSKFNPSLKKRPFQPSVDSYFHHANNEGINSLSVIPQHHSTAIPTLPPAIQSSLLNVGMRVRKSIPEGYKTFAKCSATDTENRHSGIEPWRRSTAAPPSELMPYCGILHVGGHENKPAAIEEGLEFDTDESDLLSSQESVTSLSIEPVPPIFPRPGNKKRPLNDFLDLQPVTSPLSPIGPTRLSDLNRLRHKLEPKSAIRRHFLAAEQECEQIVVDDFEEATFLRPKD